MGSERKENKMIDGKIVEIKYRKITSDPDFSELKAALEKSGLEEKSDIGVTLTSLTGTKAYDVELRFEFYKIPLLRKFTIYKNRVGWFTLNSPHFPTAEECLYHALKEMEKMYQNIIDEIRELYVNLEGRGE
jgi:hypothetical protein